MEAESGKELEKRKVEPPKLARDHLRLDRIGLLS